MDDLEALLAPVYLRHKFESKPGKAAHTVHHTDGTTHDLQPLTAGTVTSTKAALGAPGSGTLTTTITYKRVGPCHVWANCQECTHVNKSMVGQVIRSGPEAYQCI